MEDDDELVPEPDSKGQLVLSNRAWVNLDPSIWELSAKLVKLDVSYNHIVEIPHQIGELSMLKEFIACFNKITTIPPEIGRLKRLRKLILNSNRIRKIPTELGSMDMLEELIISENYLEELPGTVCKIQNLRVLKLANNKLKSIPFELSDVLTLEDIDCSNNPGLETVPVKWRGDTESILFVCRIHRDYNSRTIELTTANADLAKHSQYVEQDNLLLKEKTVNLNARIEELLKIMPKKILKRMEEDAKALRDKELSLDTDEDKEKCVIC